MLKAALTAVACFVCYAIAAVLVPGAGLGMGRLRDIGILRAGGTGKSSGVGHFSDTGAAGTRRSFVCITGQLERLELENKIVTVLQPLREAGYEPDIALILDDSSSHVTNTQRVQVDLNPAFGSYGSAVRHLRDRDFNVLTERPYEQEADPAVNDEYLSHLHRKHSMSDDQHLERAKNNVRMVNSWADCYREMTKGGADRFESYELAIRLRDDSGFLKSLDVDDLVTDLSTQPNTIISNGCRFGDGRGLNDKFAVVSVDAAETYFVGPSEYMRMGLFDERVKSSETFIYYTYSVEGMSLVQSEKIRHVVKLMSDGEGRTILHPQEGKKLRDKCGIDITNSEEPNSCVSLWNAQLHQLESLSQVCWRFHHI